MKIIIALFLISLSLFATCTNVKTLDTRYGQHLYVSGKNQISTTRGGPSPSPYWVGNYYYYFEDPTEQFNNDGSYANTLWKCYRDEYRSDLPCPSGQVADENCVCKSPPPPQVCSWAITPPWFATLRSQIECHNGSGYGSKSDVTGDDMYLFNFTWCNADSTCYAKRYYCPAGSNYDPSSKSCKKDPAPKPDPKYCPAGFYPTAIKRVSVGNVETCGQDWICKNNPDIIFHREFSCGSGPVDDDNGPINPDAPTASPEPDKAPSGYEDHSAKCGTEKLMAQSSCQAPNILSFSCDPKTGTVLKSTCTPPNNPNPDGSAPGDDTKGATTKDIKDLGDNLPKKIKDAFRDFFMEGSENLLSTIGEYTRTQTILQADSNDKLDAISASSDASLALQSDSNEHLSGIKTSVDGLKGNLEGGNGIPSSSFITDADIVPDGTIGSTIENLSSDLSSIQTQFTNAKNIVSGNFTPPTFSGGSCPTLVGPAGITVNPAQIGATLSPYAPIISILVYISIMFITFGSVFKFLSRGLK